MAIADASGLPISAIVECATPHEVTLVRATIQGSFIQQRPPYIIGDKAYDSDPLDQALKDEEGIELIAPNRSCRKSTPRQDGRKLRRYRRRWKIERLFAWLHNYRRIVVRYEYYSANYLAFVVLACSLILLRHF
jgi:transposase